MKRPFLIVWLILILHCTTAAVWAEESTALWWRKTGIVNALQGQQSLFLALDDKGTQLCFGTETGAWQLCEQRADKHLCRTTNGNRRWANFVEPKSKP